jgi:hypothetical protein
MSRKYGTPSTIEVSDDLGCQVIPLVTKPPSHFTTEEDRFFSEGEALSNATGTPDASDDITAARPSRHLLTRNRSLMGGTVGVIVIMGTVLLVRSGGRAADGTADPTPAQPTQLVTTTPQPVQAPPPVVAQPAAAAPVLAATPVPTPTPTAKPDQPSPAPAPADARVSPSPAHPSAGAAAGSEASMIKEACKVAYEQRRAKDVLLRCADAFAADPQSAEPAVMLAKTEFDRGRTSKAADWARKAIAIDGDQADAYVFLGGAEQAAGHKAAAKAAYKRYLQLSPQGRYAADLRAVMGSL